jgi:hypothetical protein
VKASVKKILRSILAIFLVVALQLPVAAKISHAIFNHIEVDCNDYGSLHIHEIEFDCEFQKYNFLNKGVLPDYQSFHSEFLVVSEQIFSAYTFLNKYQELHFSLRGPPAFS